MLEEQIHYGRSWVDHYLEDICPCDKAPCGLVIQGQESEECDQHGLANTRTIRQIHTAHSCPGKR